VQRLTRTVHSFAIAATLLASCSSLANAQDSRQPDPRRPDAPYIYSMDVGWKRMVIQDRWNPVCVWLAGGARGFTGTLHVSYVQDGTQQASIILPVSATPGVTVPVDFVAALPRGANTIDLALVADNGYVVDRTRAVSLMGENNELPLSIEPFEAGTGPIVSIGATSIERSSLIDRASSLSPTPNYWQPQAEKRKLTEHWSDFRPVRVEPDRAPRVWSAFDGLASVVIESSTISRLGSREREALTQWMLQGGRVVVVVSSPGAEWRTLLPSQPSFDVVQIAPSITLTTPDAFIAPINEVHQAIKLNQAAGDPAQPASGATDADAPVQSGAQDPSVEASAGDGSSAQSQETDAPAEEAVADEQTDQAPPEQPAGSQAGPLAPPPAGMRDIPPLAFAATINARPISLTPRGHDAGWTLRWPIDDFSALLAEGPVGLGHLTLISTDPERLFEVVNKHSTSAAWFDAIRDLPTDAQKSEEPSYYRLGTGSTVAESKSVTAALDLLVADRSMNLFMFIPVWLCAALLAILIGPVDAIMLKRLNARQRSWSTAIGWCVLIAGIAAYVPAAIRTAPTTLDRMSILDIKLPRDPGEPPIAAVTSVASVFGGKASMVHIDAYTPATFVHGVSAIASEYTTTKRGLPTLDTVWRTMTEGDMQSPTLVPHDLWIGQWMMRAFLERGPVVTSIRASAVKAGSGKSINVTITGLPPGASLSELSVAIKNQTYATSQPIKADDSGELTLTMEPLTGEWTPPAVADFAGSAERYRSMIKYAAMGQYAILRAQCTPLRQSPDADPALGGRQITHLRILVPLDDATSEDAGATQP
jgi:hypothetical protein